MSAQSGASPPKQNALLCDKQRDQMQINATDNGAKTSGPLVSGVKNAAAVTTYDCSAERIIKCVRSGKWRKPVEHIRRVFSTALVASAGSRQAAKKAVAADKKELPGVMWSGQFGSRKRSAAEKLLKHSGLLCADLDDLGEQLADVRAKLLASPHLFALFASPTGGGLKVIFRVVVDAAKHAASFRAVERHVCELELVSKISECEAGIIFRATTFCTCTFCADAVESFGCETNPYSTTGNGRK